MADMTRSWEAWEIGKFSELRNHLERNSIQVDFPCDVVDEKEKIIGSYTAYFFWGGPDVAVYTMKDGSGKMTVAGNDIDSLERKFKELDQILEFKEVKPSA